MASLAPIRQDRPLLFILVGLTFGNLPLFAVHLANLWTQPQYQYFPMVLVVIGWLVYRGAEWRREPLASRWEMPTGIIAIVVALGLSFAATLIGSPWVATVSVIVAFGGVLLVLRRWLDVENAVGIWCLSLLLLKLPMGFDTKLAFFMQGVTARVAGSILDLIGVANLVDGNTIILRSQHLFVEQA